MIEMFTNIAPMPGFEWVQVSETKFNRYVDENVLVRQSNGKIQRFYDCEVDAITAIKEMHRFDFYEEAMFYVQKEKK